MLNILQKLIVLDLQLLCCTKMHSILLWHINPYLQLHQSDNLVNVMWQRGKHLRRLNMLKLNYKKIIWRPGSVSALATLLSQHRKISFSSSSVFLL